MKQSSARIFLLVSALLLLCICGCKSKAKDPFPVAGEVDGWQKTDETRTFAAKDLWQYIDGDSEQYVQAGVISTSTSDYKYKAEFEAVIDIHTMRDAGGATRIFENGHSADARTVPLGDAGFAYSQSVVFRKGPHLVRIVAWQSNPQTADALLALARGVEAKL